MFEDVDDYLVGWRPCVKTRDTHQGWKLANRNIDGRTSHEGRNCGQRDEIDNPTHPDEADKGDDGATNNSQGRSYHMSLKLWVRMADFEHYIADNQRHDGHRLGTCQLPNPEKAHLNILTPIVISLEVAKNQ